MNWTKQELKKDHVKAKLQRDLDHDTVIKKYVSNELKEIENRDREELCQWFKITPKEKDWSPILVNNAIKHKKEETKNKL